MSLGSENFTLNEKFHFVISLHLPLVWHRRWLNNVPVCRLDEDQRLTNLRLLTTAVNAGNSDTLGRRREFIH